MFAVLVATALLLAAAARAADHKLLSLCPTDDFGGECEFLPAECGEW